MLVLMTGHLDFQLAYRWWRETRPLLAAGRDGGQTLEHVLRQLVIKLVGMFTALDDDVHRPAQAL